MQEGWQKLKKSKAKTWYESNSNTGYPLGNPYGTIIFNGNYWKAVN